MSIDSVVRDNRGNPVVLLRVEDQAEVLPIWVGQAEALSIAIASEKIKMGRPMTHDLIKNLINTIDLAVEWIRVTDIKEGTFYATIRLTSKERQIDLDSRPSDAIALALRVDAPIFVSEQVLSEALRTDLGSMKSLEDLDEDFLANLPDEIFGKYKM